MRKKSLLSTVSAGILAAALVLPGFHIAYAQTATTGSVQSALPFGFLYRENLSMGERSTDVASLQGYLSELGFLEIPRGVAPGYFGELTRSALARYQTSIGVPADGMFDARTKATIVAQLSSKYPQYSWAWGGAGATTAASGNVATNAPSMAPQGQTGYWHNGNWYNAVPTANTSGVTGYWQNGTWYSIGSGPVASDSGSTGMGYWYNGAWYPVSSTEGGGYYSSAPQSSSGSMASGSNQGYWYNGVWYPTASANIGGGENSDSSSSQTSSNGSPTSGVSSQGIGYWQNGVWYSLSAGSSNPTSGPSGINYSTNLTPTGYWQNGMWYASVPNTSQTANVGIPGYWQNNKWYSLDSSQTTAYGTPNPTSPSTGSGYWQNGVWYPTSSGMTGAMSGGYWLNGIWYSTDSSNNTSGPGSTQ